MTFFLLISKLYRNLLNYMGKMQKMDLSEYGRNNKKTSHQ